MQPAAWLGHHGYKVINIAPEILMEQMSSAAGEAGLLSESGQDGGWDGCLSLCVEACGSGESEYMLKL